jgi:hypothetical protein
MNVKKRKFFILFISLIYVMISTISIFSLYPRDLMFNNYSIYGLIFTFPISIFSFGVRYANPEIFYPILGIQVLMFIVTFQVCDFFIPKSKK